MFRVFLRKITILLLTPIVFCILPLVLLFREKTEVLNGVQRYRLPHWLFWFQTPDCDLPADIENEPTCKKWYDRYGSFICSWLWLGARNVLHGYNWQFGKPAPMYLVWMTEEQQEEWDIYRKVVPFGFLKLIHGWSVYKDTYNLYSKTGFWSVPTFTIRLRSQD